MEDFKKFITNYWGCILGAIIGLVIACTGIYRLIVGIVLVVIGAWLGNYFQNNKDTVKEKLKKFIDKL